MVAIESAPMADSARRRNILIALVVLIIVILLLLSRCLVRKPVTPAPSTGTAAVPVQPHAGANEPPRGEPAEMLGPATLKAPAQVPAGGTFAVAWTGPDNAGDYV